MKTTLKIVTVSTAVALIMASVPTRTYAGDREWATVGKVLTGVAAVGVIAALADQDVHAEYHYVNHCPPPPPPPRCEPPPGRWIPGHYETRQEKFSIPGHWDVVVVPAEYGWVRCGWHGRYVMLRPECTRRIWVPETCEIRTVQVWVPARYETVQVRPYDNDHRRFDKPQGDDDDDRRSNDSPVPGRFKDQNRGESYPRETAYRN